MVKRIGITMRVDQAVGYDEPRDALAQDWAQFLAYALPEVTWLPIPNLGEDVLNFVQEWKIDGIILSGGNDVGVCPKRDETERVLMTQALANEWPVFGVCRGLQMIQTFFGGKLERCAKEIHVAKEHRVLFVESMSISEAMVNSFHNFGVGKNDLSDRLEALATTDDGWIEAIKAKHFPIWAVMWHPERGRPFREYDRDLIRACFGVRDSSQFRFERPELGFLTKLGTVPKLR